MSSDLFKALPPLVQEAAIGMVAVDSAQRIVLFNGGAERLFGYRAEEVLGQPLDLLIPAASRARHRELVTGLAEGALHARRMEGRPAIRGLRKDGGSFPARASISKVRVDGETWMLAVLRNTAESGFLTEEPEIAAHVTTLLADQSGLGLVICDPSGDILKVNPGFSRLMGESPLNFAGKPFVLRVAAHDRAMVKGLMTQALDRGGFGPLEATLIAAGKRPLSVRLHGHVARGEEGDQLWVSVDDITARKEAERIRDRLAHAQHVARIGSWELDLASGEVWFSDEIYSICGLDRGTRVRNLEGAMDLVHPEDRESVRDGIARATAERTPWAMRHRVLRPDGLVRIVQQRGEISYGSKGEPLRMLGTCQDITDRVHMENRLNAAHRDAALVRDRLNEAQRVARIGNWEWDIASGSLWWSDEVYRIFGYRPGMIQPSYETFLSWIPDEDRVRVEAAVAEALQDRERSYTVRHRIVLPDGREGMVEERGRTFYDDDGTAVRMIGTCQDITEQMILENQLHQAQKMEAVGQLTAGIAHDFNNLLGIALANIELLEERLPASDPARTLLEPALSSIRRGAHLTGRLMAFSRQQDLAMQAVALSRLIPETEVLLARSCGKAVRLETVLDPGLPAIWTDPVQLETALLNLANNARDAMEGRGSLILMARDCGTPRLPRAREPGTAHPLPGFPAELRGSESGFVCISMIDSGPGMSAEVLRRVLDPFFTTKPPGQGTGLGLSMVYGFIRQSGGAMTLESAPGKGTGVHLFLPHAPLNEPDQATA